MDWPVVLPPDLLRIAGELSIVPSDIEEQFVRGSGRGGQKMNKTSSTVQLRHAPSGIEVRCQDYREQSKNRLAAWKHLILKIEERCRGEESRLARERFKVRKQKQRRTRRAKDHMLRDKHQRSEIKEQRRPPMAMG